MTVHFLVAEPNGHVTSLNGEHGIEPALARVVSLSKPRLDSKGRLRHDTYQVGLKLLEQEFGREANRARADSIAVRGDSFSPAMGAPNPRDLTHKFSRILEERRKPLDGKRIFGMNTEVKPGAKRYEQYRSYATGEAVVYRGGAGTDIPEVGIGMASFDHPVVYVASRHTIEWLENLSNNYTGLDTQARKMRASLRAIEELEDRWTFLGDEQWGLFGLLNHPYVDTAISNVAYNDSTTDADDIAADFAVWANYAENTSGGACRPDTLLIATKLDNYLRNRPFGDNKDKSVMDWILSANPHIKRVERVHRLNDAGGAGIHAMSFCRTGEVDGSAEIVKPLTTTLLAPESRALITQMFAVSGFGGLNQSEVGDNLNVYVEGPA